MVGQNTNPPENVYWQVYNTPDYTGASSGYPGQLINIAISYQTTLFTPATPPIVTGSKGGNAALTSLMAALVSLGLVIDQTT